MFPFSAIVGHSLSKRALLLLAIEPRLRGVLISSVSGSGKSLLIKAFTSIFLKVGQQNGKVKRGRMVKIPLGVTEDRLIGGLNFEAEPTSKSLPCTRGLLTEANEGILAIDDILHIYVRKAVKDFMIKYKNYKEIKTNVKTIGFYIKH